MASCKVNSILFLVLVVVRMTCCDAQENNSTLQLHNFVVIKAEPPHYKVGKPTTVTFSANYGRANLDPTSQAICIFFFTNYTGPGSIRNVGQVNITLPDSLPAGHLDRETVEITLTQEACTHKSKPERGELCAGIKDDSQHLTDPYCLPFKEIDDGGAGEIECSEDQSEESVQPYIVAIPIGLVLLLVAVVVFFLLYWKCCRKRTDLPSSRTADQRDRFRSLPHIYADPFALTGEPAYDSTLPKDAGSSNAAFHTENQSEGPYSTNLSVAMASDKSPNLAELLRKRPSQANAYIIEDSPTPMPKPRKISMTGNNPDVIVEVGLTQVEEATDDWDNPYLPPKPKVRQDSTKLGDNLEQQAVLPNPPIPKPRPLSLHNDQDTTPPPRPPRPPPRIEPDTKTTKDGNTSSSRPKLTQKPTLSLPRLYSPKKPNLPSKPKPTRTSNSDVDPEVLKNAIAQAFREEDKKRRTSIVKSPLTVMAEDIQENAQMPDPNDPDFVSAVMQNYLSLMFEMSRGEEEYQSTMKRELERIDSNTLSVEPQLETRRKSLSAQLTLNLARKNNRDSEIYVNQWNKSWEVKRSHLEVDMTKPLGEGQFGKVYKGKATMVKGQECDMDVAVKVLKDDAGNDAKDEFLKELAIHTILKPHPHVVQLIGCCIRDDPIYIVTEYLSGGNLLGHLRDRPSHLTGRAFIQHYVVKFGLQIARGMDYVSRSEIVHRDLAARNILVGENDVCKVADFGFARDIFGLAYYPKSPERAPIRWYAPEAILDDMFSTKSDVWSFGILLFEIATLGKVAPYQGMDNNQVRFSVSSSGHPKRPVNCDDVLFKIMKICWAKDPDERPTFHELVVLFEGIQDKYPKPNQADSRPVDSSLRQEINPQSHQRVNPDPHPEFRPEPQTVEANPALHSKVNNNPIPQIRLNPKEEVNSDPNPVDPDIPSTDNTNLQPEFIADLPSEVDPYLQAKVDPNPHPEVGDNPHPIEVDPDVPSTANTNLQPEFIADLQSEVDPNPDPEIDHDLPQEVATDDVSPTESETEEEESF